MKKTRIILITIVIIIVGAIIVARSMKQERTAFYYLDRNNLGDESTRIISDGTFGTYEGCLNRLRYAKSKNPSQNYDSECGLNCKKVQGFVGMYYSCEDTKDGI